jgi:hypothetical protein
MRRSAFTRIHTAWTSSEADEIVGRLRYAGLHPVDLRLLTPLAVPGAEPVFPIEVPAEEAAAARELMMSCHDYS